MKPFFVLTISSVSVVFVGSNSISAQETPTLDTTVVTGSATPGAGSYYGVQGNTAMVRSLHEKELAAAAHEARVKKELMAAMAAQSMAARPPTFTTAEQYLAANKPPTPPPSDDDVDNFVPRTSYVPDFKPVPEIRQTVKPPPRQLEMPKKKMRLLDRLKAKKNDVSGPEFDMENPYLNSPPPSADYSEAGAPPSPEEMAARDAALLDATQAEPPVSIGNLPSKEKKGGFFSKLFKPSGDTTPASVPEYTDPAPPMVADTPPSTPVSTPSAPAPTATSSDSPPERPASIFMRRDPNPAVSGRQVSMVQKAEANVGGVLVALFPGDQVELIEKTGNTAKIRLPDQRIGTVSASALSE